jgi:hypothetical protein
MAGVRQHLLGQPVRILHVPARRYTSPQVRETLR